MITMSPAAKIGQLRFRPRLWPSLAALLVVALALAAANWQFGRAEQKRALQAKFDEAQALPALPLKGGEPVDALQYRHIVARGEWAPDKAIWLDNKTYKGLAGYQLLMPVRLAGSEQFLLVNRGWVPRSANLAKAAAARAGLVEVRGLAVVPPAKYFELSQDTIAGNVWQNLRLERYTRRYSVSVLPVVVEQDSHAADGLIREWSRPDAGVQKHVAYAVQWLCIAAVVVVLYVVLNTKRRG